MTEDDKRRVRYELRTAFRPSAPIDKQNLFAGRIRQIDVLIEAILEPGKHVALYGERGVGKTSLAKTLVEILAHSGIRTVNSDTINCDATDDFSSLWHKAFRELTFKMKVRNRHFNKEETEEEHNLEDLIPKRVSPDDVRRALASLEKKSVIVFDEFDRIQTNETKTLMADTIKNLSDHTVDTTLILVGVAQSVTDLIAEHRSIARAIQEVMMPRMSPTELMEIITKGFARMKDSFTIEDVVADKILRLSHGLAHYTHLLSLESGLAAVKRDSNRIEDSDFKTAVNEIVTTKQTVANEYYSAVSSTQKSSRHKQTLLACALSPIDGQGLFLAPDTVAVLERLYQKKHKVSDIQKHLTEFVSHKRECVLQRQGSLRQYRYRFSNPLVQPYTIIHSLSENLITESQIWMLGQQSFGR